MVIGCGIPIESGYEKIYLKLNIDYFINAEVAENAKKITNYLKE
jgi:hypothetical protein